MRVLSGRWQQATAVTGEVRSGAWVIELDGQTVAEITRGDHWTYRAACAKRRGCSRLHPAPLTPCFRSFREGERWIELHIGKAILKAIGQPASPRQEAAARLESMALAVA